MKIGRSGRLENTGYLLTEMGQSPISRCPTRLMALSLLVALGLGVGIGCGSESAPAVPVVAVDLSQVGVDIYETTLRPPSGKFFAAVDRHPIQTTEGLAYKLVSYTRTFDVDRLYGSMEGPSHNFMVPMRNFFIWGKEEELLWVKGVYAEIVDELGETVSQEFMCHMTAAVPRTQGAPPARFATLSQGLYHTEYPPGFGFPMLSNEKLAFSSQVLNRNHPDRIRVRHRIVTIFIRDQDLRSPLTGLRSTYAQTLVQLGGEEGDGYYGVPKPDVEEHGLSCSPGDTADTQGRHVTDSFGREFTSWWMVKPGRVTNDSNATHQLKIDADTTIHSIDVHLHPFAESVELLDLTTGESLFHSRATAAEWGIGLSHVETFHSKDGIPIYKDHQYSIRSVYDNTTDEEQDAMAVMYIGLRDPDFDSEPLATSAETLRRRRDNAARAIANQVEKVF